MARPWSRRREPAAERVFMASPWRLTWWRFSSHRLALASAGFLVLAYLVVVFAEFFAPCDPRQRDASRIYCPPQRLRFVDADGGFHAWPFVYGVKGSRDPLTLRRKYLADTSQRLPLRLFVRGDRYRLWGLIESDLHLFGVAEGHKVYLLGGDRMGQDVLSRAIFGGRLSLSIGLLGICISLFLGILIGGVSGYFGGWIDTFIQRVIEFMNSIPKLPLWMGLSAALPAHWSIEKVYFGMVVILSLLAWPGLARTVRGKFMALKEEDFVMAARLDGARPLRIIFRYLLPSFLSHVIANVSLAIPAMILGETSLSFLGLGLQPPAISWGVLLVEAQAIHVLAYAPWLLYPGLFIIVSVLAFNFVGDGLRDAADPYAHV